MYDSYAHVYDGSGQVRFALLMAPYLDAILCRHPVTGTRALDLACGTGTLALELAERGWQVLGVDQSATMLAHAQAKAHGATLGGHVRFLVGDMRELPAILPVASVDLGICTFDSLNYLPDEAALGACLRGIAHVLRPGGLFVADMNTGYFLAQIWAPCEIGTYAGYTEIGQSQFDPQRTTITVALTGFVGTDNDGYERFDEVHCERAYEEATLHALSAAAGLVVEAVYDCFTFSPPSPQTQRIMWMLRRPETITS